MATTNIGIDSQKYSVDSYKLNDLVASFIDLAAEPPYPNPNPANP
jgi:hypothetical protein